jgi:hypothetical protein
MPELIIPAGVKADYRPYRNASTPALMYELQQRQIIAEIGGQIMMPQIDRENIKPEALDEVRKAQFLQMAQQLGVAIAQSEFALPQVMHQPNVMDPEAPPDETLILKFLLCKHPLRETLTATAAIEKELIAHPEKGYQPKNDG